MRFLFGLTLAVCIGASGCGWSKAVPPTAPNPATPETTVVCIMHETTIESLPFPGNDTYLGSPGAESKIIDRMEFLRDSSSLDVRWHFTTSGGNPNTPFVFSIMAKNNNGSGTPIFAWFDGGNDKLYLYGRNIDTTVVAHFATGRNVALDNDYKIYAKWLGSTSAPANAFGATSTLCSSAGATELTFRRWEESCTTIIHQ